MVAAGLITFVLLLGLNGADFGHHVAAANSVAGQDRDTQTTFTSPKQLSLPLAPFTDFPRLIWQTGSTDGIAKYRKQSSTWTKLNPSHNHTILTDSAADEFVHNHFKHRPSITQFWDTLETPVLRADLLRYLLMLSRGGVYSDIDTSCLEPIDSWIPPEYRLRTNAVVAIEYDDNTYSMFVRPISFNQWTLMAKPDHPIFARAVDRVISNLEFLARQKKTTLGQLKLEMTETLEATGPGMITDVVMEVLRDQVGKSQKIDWRTFQGLKEPLLIGDVLVLPINGFAGHQKHSHSGEKGYGRMLVRHWFGRTWYNHKGREKVSKRDNATDIKDVKR
jgi:alpha 1,6-mannosyltransferase